jgi:hypothetical protein
MKDKICTHRLKQQELHSAQSKGVQKLNIKPLRVLVKLTVQALPIPSDNDLDVFRRDSQVGSAALVRVFLSHFLKQ